MVEARGGGGEQTETDSPPTCTRYAPRANGGSLRPFRRVRDNKRRSAGLVLGLFAPTCFMVHVWPDPQGHGIGKVKPDFSRSFYRRLFFPAVAELWWHAPRAAFSHGSGAPKARPRPARDHDGVGSSPEWATQGLNRPFRHAYRARLLGPDIFVLYPISTPFEGGMGH